MKVKLPLLIGAILAFFLLGLFHGSVDIPAAEVARCLTGGGDNEAWRYIVMESRLPQTLTALLAGGALAVSGLLLQTTFRNPLAAPDIFGITSGASLGVALVTLAPTLVAGAFIGSLSKLVAAFIGAVAVTAVIWSLSRWVRSGTVLVIAGVIIGYLCSSLTTLLNFFATEEGVRSFVVWGMGDFGNVTMAQMPLFAGLTLLATGATLLMVKPLNALLMGPRYAASLGVNVRRFRNILLLVTGLLTAVVTAFCGPVAFIALAVPHIARLIFKTADHRRLVPATILTGSAVALLCNVLTTLPSGGTMLPLNAVTPLVGAPVIIYVILRRK